MRGQSLAFVVNMQRVGIEPTTDGVKPLLYLPELHLPGHRTKHSCGTRLRNSQRKCAGRDSRARSADTNLHFRCLYDTALTHGAESLRSALQVGALKTKSPG